MSEKYNGWTNWETWLCNLWITNDQFLVEEARDLDTPHDLLEWFEEFATEGLEGFVADCVNGTISTANWYEIYVGLHEGEAE